MLPQCVNSPDCTMACRYLHHICRMPVAAMLPAGTVWAHLIPPLIQRLQQSGPAGFVADRGQRAGDAPWWQSALARALDAAPEGLATENLGSGLLARLDCPTELSLKQRIAAAVQSAGIDAAKYAALRSGPAADAVSRSVEAVGEACSRLRVAASGAASLAQRHMKADLEALAQELPEVAGRLRVSSVSAAGDCRVRMKMRMAGRMGLVGDGQHFYQKVPAPLRLGVVVADVALIVTLNKLSLVTAQWNREPVHYFRGPAECRAWMASMLVVTELRQLCNDRQRSLVSLLKDCVDGSVVLRGSQRRRGAFQPAPASGSDREMRGHLYFTCHCCAACYDPTLATVFTGAREVPAAATIHSGSARALSSALPAQPSPGV